VRAHVFCSRVVVFGVVVRIEKEEPLCGFPAKTIYYLQKDEAMHDHTEKANKSIRYPSYT